MSTTANTTAPIAHTSWTVAESARADEAEWRRMHADGDLRLRVETQNLGRGIDSNSDYDLAVVPDPDEAVSVIIDARAALDDLPAAPDPDAAGRTSTSLDETGVVTWVVVLRPGSDDWYSVPVGRRVHKDDAAGLGQAISDFLDGVRA
jgi:hypothetical protein